MEPALPGSHAGRTGKRKRPERRAQRIAAALSRGAGEAAQPPSQDGQAAQPARPTAELALETLSIIREKWVPIFL